MPRVTKCKKSKNLKKKNSFLPQSCLNRKSIEPVSATDLAFFVIVDAKASRNSSNHILINSEYLLSWPTK
jgi:hypothetical protein